MIAPTNIVVATDFGEAAARALRYGIEFARTFNARLHVVHVVDDVASGVVAAAGGPPVDVRSIQANLDNEAERTLKAAVVAEAASGLDVRPALLHDHQPGPALLDFAREHACDLMIIGTHGQGGLADFFLGSVAQRVVRSAPCPVLTVRAKEREFLKTSAGERPVHSAAPRLH